MKLEDLVASLELSKRLVEVAKEKGVELPESYFIYVATGEDKWELTTHEYMKGNLIGEWLPAYTTGESGEILHKAHLMIDTISTTVGQEPHLWAVSYCKSIEHIEAHSKKHKAGMYAIGHLEHIEIEEAEANARVKMVIYLVGNNYITL